MATLEINRDGEWLKVFSSVSFDGVPDGWDDPAANDFLRVLRRRLEAAGFTVQDALGERATCRGWQAYSLFRHKIGPVGTFDDLTTEQRTTICDAIDSAEQSMLSRWVGTAVTPT